MANEFDPNKDKTLAEEILATDNGGYDIKICTYDGGDCKVQLSPWYIAKDGKKTYKKLGRIKLSTFEKIVEVVKRLEAQVNF